MNSILDKYRTWINTTNEMKIWNADKIKPHFDGKELTQMFGVSQGKIVKHLLNDQFSWQLMNPTKTKEDFAKYVETNKQTILTNLSGKS